MFGTIIGTIFSLVEGRFLDIVKTKGITAFSWLFVFGIIFGLINTFLFVPQADVELKKEKETVPFIKLFTDSFRNKGLMIMALFSLVWSLQAIAGPFYAAYVIRDLKMPFIGLGILSACSGLIMIASSTFWGKMIDKHGCKPILITAAAIVAPTCIAWSFVDTPLKAYLLIIPINLFQGFWMSAISVCSNTIIYKITPEKGRSVQLAVHAVIAILVAAPMPTLGGYLPKIFGTDLRITFIAAGVFQFASAIVAYYLPETGASKPTHVLSDLRDKVLPKLKI